MALIVHVASFFDGHYVDLSFLFMLAYRSLYSLPHFLREQSGTKASSVQSMCVFKRCSSINSE